MSSIDDSENQWDYDNEGEYGVDTYGEESLNEEEENKIFSLHLMYGATALWNVTVGMLL